MTKCIFCNEEFEGIEHADIFGDNPLCSRCNEVRKVIKDFELINEPRFGLFYKDTEIEIKK